MYLFFFKVRIVFNMLDANSFLLRGLILSYRLREHVNVGFSRTKDYDNSVKTL